MKKSSLTAMLPLLLMAAAACNPCTDEIFSRVPSPDSTLVATAFIRNCGATVGWLTVVGLQLPDEAIPGNDKFVLILEDRRRDLAVEWLGSRELVVRCAGCERDRISKQLVVLNGITVHVVTGDDVVN